MDIGIDESKIGELSNNRQIQLNFNENSRRKRHEQDIANRKKRQTNKKTLAINNKTKFYLSLDSNLWNKQQRTLLWDEKNGLKQFENGLKRTGRWTLSDSLKWKVEYWQRIYNQNKCLLYQKYPCKWIESSLKEATAKLKEADLPQKKGWFFGGKHRKTHKRPNHNKRRHTKRNRN